MGPLMKLLYCPKCDDVFKLAYAKRSCKCGKVSGKYLLDGLQAVYTGGVPLGFANSSLLIAIKNQRPGGLGREFIAFVIPKNCATMVAVAKID